MGRARKEGGLEIGRRALRNFDVSIRRRFHTMLKRLLTTLLFVGAVFGLSPGANAQYMRILTDNPTDNTRLRASGTTLLTITLVTDHDKDLSLQSCNSHQVAAACPGATLTGQPLNLSSYQIH